jgi:hypothetical protein
MQIIFFNTKTNKYSQCKIIEKITKLFRNNNIFFFNIIIFLSMKYYHGLK